MGLVVVLHLTVAGAKRTALLLGIKLWYSDSTTARTRLPLPMLVTRSLFFALAPITVGNYTVLQAFIRLKRPFFHFVSYIAPVNFSSNAPSCYGRANLYLAVTCQSNGQPISAQLVWRVARQNCHGGGRLCVLRPEYRTPNDRFQRSPIENW